MALGDVEGQARAEDGGSVGAVEAHRCGGEVEGGIVCVGLGGDDCIGMQSVESYLDGIHCSLMLLEGCE